MKILLTGGDGMLAKALIPRLKESHDVRVLTRNEVDLRSSLEVLKVFEANSYELVIHCAARVGGIGANIGNSTTFLVDNSLLDLNVLDAAQKSDIKRFIYFSSSCVYPADITDAMSEDMILSGKVEKTNEGYALAKILGMSLAKFISEEKGFSYRTLILSNLYGPNDNFNPNRSHLVSSIIRKLNGALSKHENEIVIWGSGFPRREFTYVGDVALWVSENIKYISEFPNWLNLGSGIDYSVTEYYQMIGKILGYRGNYVYDTSRPDGIAQKLLDSTIARERFGWSPETSLEAGVIATYDWWCHEQAK
jgi:GDP-L-fucose synthase